MTVIYTLTVFCSAFLLFLIQPMISKLMLPQLGGSPAVWNTAMMFFQIFLLLGYLYTHFATKWLGVKKQSILHICLLFVALAWLPISLYTDISHSSSEYPITWVITSLFFSVGIPFFMLASNAPLIQVWMASTMHKDASNPYFLYSASNLGSLMALLAYPFLIEPGFSLSSQTLTWSYIFGVFMVLVAAAVWLLHKNYRTAEFTRDTSNGTTTIPGWKTKLYWIALAFAPSSLMLGVTTYITTDISSMPLFWVIPLTLYLLTFILAFSRITSITSLAIKTQTILVPLTIFVMIFGTPYLFAGMFLHLITFFITAMVCHGTLAQHKPSTTYLTEYFVWISFGGMLGGIFNTLVAPHLLTNPIEYMLIFVLALLLRPTLPHKRKEVRPLINDLLIPCIFAALLTLIFILAREFLQDFDKFLLENVSRTLGRQHQIATLTNFGFIVFFYVLLMMAVDYVQHRPLRFTLCIFLLIIIGNHSIFNPTPANAFHADRNFFGVTAVYEKDGLRQMYHGTTVHGIQSLDPAGRLTPLSYYTHVKHMLHMTKPPLQNYPYAVIGLGVGTLACIGRRDQFVDFFEIDPAVITMAKNPHLFTYLQDCPTKKTIILGDGRLEISKMPENKYGMIVIDAFSSDAIPVHLLTQEALAIYRRKLTKNGILAFNISNRYLDLGPVLAVMAKEMGMHSMQLLDMYDDDRSYASRWMIVTEDETYIERYSSDPIPDVEFTNFDTTDTSGFSLWTDNYNNILEAFN